VSASAKARTRQAQAATLKTGQTTLISDANEARWLSEFFQQRRAFSRPLDKENRASEEAELGRELGSDFFVKAQ
jgi:6-phosphogluconate dehydrogenase